MSTPAASKDQRAVRSRGSSWDCQLEVLCGIDEAQAQAQGQWRRAGQGQGQTGRWDVEVGPLHGSTPLRWSEIGPLASKSVQQLLQQQQQHLEQQRMRQQQLQQQRMLASSCEPQNSLTPHVRGPNPRLRSPEGEADRPLPSNTAHSSSSSTRTVETVPATLTTALMHRTVPLGVGSSQSIPRLRTLSSVREIKDSSADACADVDEAALEFASLSAVSAAKTEPIARVEPTLPRSVSMRSAGVAVINKRERWQRLMRPSVPAAEDLQSSASSMPRGNSMPREVPNCQRFRTLMERALTEDDVEDFSLGPAKRNGRGGEEEGLEGDEEASKASPDTAALSELRFEEWDDAEPKTSSFNCWSVLPQSLPELEAPPAPSRDGCSVWDDDEQGGEVTEEGAKAKKGSQGCRTVRPMPSMAFGSFGSMFRTSAERTRTGVLCGAGRSLSLRHAERGQGEHTRNPNPLPTSSSHKKVQGGKGAVEKKWVRRPLPQGTRDAWSLNGVEGSRKMERAWDITMPEAVESPALSKRGAKTERLRASEGSRSLREGATGKSRQDRLSLNGPRDADAGAVSEGRPLGQKEKSKGKRKGKGKGKGKGTSSARQAGVPASTSDKRPACKPSPNAGSSGPQAEPERSLSLPHTARMLRGEAPPFLDWEWDSEKSDSSVGTRIKQLISSVVPKPMGF